MSCQGDVAVLTNVSFDHTDVLGPTLEGIATDKAGIIEPGSRVVVGEMAPELADIVTSRAHEVGAASVWVAGRDFGCESNRVAVGGRVVTLWTPGGRYEDILVPLHGAHQGVNASVALAAVEAFFGDPLDADVVEEGLAAVRVPGRLEVLGRRPLLLVDGAHNAAGMAALADALAEEFAVDGTTVAVVGMLSGRDPSAMLAPLAVCRRLRHHRLRTGFTACHAGRSGVRGGPRARSVRVRGTECHRRVARGARHGRRRRAGRGGRVALRRRRRPGRRAGGVRPVGGSRSLTADGIRPRVV